MAASSLLALIDDIATVLDDVAILSKVAAKKTAGVLGDDLALNAEQVSGVKASREIPVVWAVAKGSFINKLILVPAALAISAFAPPLITVLLVIGGLFLCYEGVEKIAEKLLHSKKEMDNEHQQQFNALVDENVDFVVLEKQKIKGAIRTDFVLSAEIVVIALGTVKDAAFETQVLVISGLAMLITVGVYGLVAAIVKLDDLGLYLLRKSVSGSFNALQRALGRGLLIFAPQMMKLLSVVGTIAMFLVGGGILVHNFHWLHQQITQVSQWFNALTGPMSANIVSMAMEGMIGVIAGAIVLTAISMITKLKNKKRKPVSSK
ncbi:DUF808 domain-containing protein [Colwelliaceae bacterium 6471]